MKVGTIWRFKYAGNTEFIADSGSSQRICKTESCAKGYLKDQGCERIVVKDSERSLLRKGA